MRRALLLALFGATVAVVLLLPLLAIWRGRDSRVWSVAARARPWFLRQGPALPPPVTLPLLRGLSVTPDGWRWFQPHLVTVVDGAPSMTLRSSAESVWFHNERGPMLWVPVDGDLDATVRVRTRKASATEEFPDAAWQFGGLMLRDPTGDAPFSRENHVFNVVGHRGTRLQVETKSTRDGDSAVRGFDWESGDADLRIIRRGATVEMLGRPIGEREWTTFIRYERPDLPSLLQVGMILYSYDYGGGRFDLQVEFESIEINRPPD